MERQPLMDRLAARFVAHHDTELTGVFQFDLGAEALIFHLVVEGGRPTFVPGRHPEPSLLLAMSPEDYLAMFEGDLTQLFAEGRLKVEGDLRLGLQLAAVLAPQASAPEWHPDRERIEAVSAAGPRLVEVERRALSGAGDLQARYARASRPLVVLGALEGWDRHALSRESLAGRFGHLRVVPRVGDYVSSAFSSAREYAPMSLREYLDLLDAPAGGAPPPYLGNSPVPDELLPFLKAPPWFAEGALGRPSLWLGPAGTVTPLHRDLVDNALAQVWGRKRVILYPPEDSRCFETWRSSEVLDGTRFDPEQPDHAAHPLAREGHPVELTLEAGEVLFLPAGWFHHVRSLAPSLSVNFFQFYRPPAAMEA